MPNTGNTTGTPVKLVDAVDANQPPIGTATNPIRVDPTGTTVQPVSVVSGGGGGTQYTTGTAVASPVGTAALGWDGADVRVLSTNASGDLNVLLTDGTHTANIDASGAVNTDIQAFGGSAITQGQKVMASSMPVVVASNQSAIAVNSTPTTAGGLSISHLVSAGTTNATNAKASPGQVYGWSIVNTTANMEFVKLHNTAGTPTPGSGVVYTIGVPGNGGTNMDVDSGIAFSTGIGFTTTALGADADTTAVGAGDLIINLHFK